ncbi:MAG: hypothetical protein JSS34_06050 [Proteobacteria bacterium]|nr:hypothetical protein [Pseudomonadota bacterium]
MESQTMLRVDSKGRICVSKLVDPSVSSFREFIDTNHRIILEPYVEIPFREQGLYENPDALDLVRRGIEESAQGKLESRGSFQQYDQN